MLSKRPRATAIPLLGLALLFSAPLAGPALAGRPPSAEERTAIEEVLRAAGYTAWEEIEFDDDDDAAVDGVWEVDDAVGADGRRYDLKLDRALSIIRQDRD